MPQKLTPTGLWVHVAGVLARSNHHAPNVRNIIPTLIGNISIYSDKDAAGADEIYAITTTDPSSTTGNVLWINIGGNRYFVGYDHSKDEIFVKEGNNRGNEIFRCSNATPNEEINNFFDGLNPGAIPVIA